MPTRTVSGTFTGTGQSATMPAHRGMFNLSLSGTWVATVDIERSFDGGSTWLIVESYTSNIEDTGDEPQDNVWYRLNCSAYTSGTVTYRLSQDAIAAYR